jgi:sulfate transport system ATP-binding protein/putative spermidine/putrescine transport system ATP-binding protein
MSVVKRLYRELKDFSVEIEDWELLEEGVTVLWGPSGSGKTTVLKALLGLDESAQVSWLWDGDDLGGKPAEQRGLGVVFQDLALFPHLTAEQNILFPVDRKRHVHWQQDFKKLTEVLHLEKLLDSPSHQLSGGEKQRVAIARALIYRPRMLMLDEPFSSLDEGLRASTRDLVTQLCRDIQCPILLVTHDREDVQQVADRVCQIALGRLVSEGNSLPPSH